MVYSRNDSTSPDGREPHGGACQDAESAMVSRAAEEKTEVSALLRLLTQLANCGLDAGAKPLLHTAQSET